MSLVPQGQSALPAKIVLPGIPLGPVKAPSDEKNVPVDRADKIAASGKFTCPMHLKIRSDQPGSCSKCGMVLAQTVVVTPAKAETPELDALKSRLWFSVVLTIPLVILSTGDVLTGGLVSRWVSLQAKTFFEVALGTLVCTWAAWPFYVSAVASVKNLSLNMFTLVGLGVSLAYGYSLFATFFPSLFTAVFRGKNGEVVVYFETAAVIVTLVLLGQVLKLRAHGATSTANKKALGLVAKPAHPFPKQDRGVEPTSLG